MKKMSLFFKKSIFAITLLFFTSNIFANDSRPSVKILNAKNKVFSLVTDTKKSTDLTVRIFDQENILLLNDKISINISSVKAYNLDNLPNGVYEIELEDETTIRKQLVKITALGLEILEENERKVYKPFFVVKDQNILFNYLNLGKGIVDLVIYDENGNEIFMTKYEDKLSINKSFNLSKFRSGKYTIQVKTSADTFRNTVTIK